MGLLDDLTKPDPGSEEFDPDWVESQFTQVPLSEKIPKEIKDMVLLAQSLAHYGYFKYEFYNLAYFYLCIVFEASLRIKYRTKRKSLAKLIERAINETLFPVEFTNKLHMIRKFRNTNAHATNPVITPVAIKGFHIVTYLINCIFDEKAREELPSVFAQEIEESRKIEGLFREIKGQEKKP